MNEINPLVRQLQIDIITGVANPIIEWFNNLWNQLYVTMVKVRRNWGDEFVYYLKEKQSGDDFVGIFYLDALHEKIYCDESKFWIKLEVDFGLAHSDVREVTKILLMGKLNVSSSVECHVNSMYWFIHQNNIKINV